MDSCNEGKSFNNNSIIHESSEFDSIMNLHVWLNLGWLKLH